MTCANLHNQWQHYNQNHVCLKSGFFPLLNGSASYSALSSYNMLSEAYGGLEFTLRIKREIQNSFLNSIRMMEKYIQEGDHD